MLENRMGPTFGLVEAKVRWGTSQYGVETLPEPGSTALLAEFEALDTSSRTLHVHVVLQGRGVGVFSYLNRYRFDARTETGFDVPDARVLVKCTAFEKGGVITPLEERPALRCKAIPAPGP